MPHSSRLLSCAAFALALSLGAPAARAEHAAITLTVAGSGGRVEATADREPPLGGIRPRPQFTVHAGDPLVLQFNLTNIYPHGVKEGVIVRYFVARTQKIGQKELPELEHGAVTQGRVVVNQKPQSRVGARLQFHVDVPGIYLVRVETLNTESDHEHFSAIDLEVK
jgi:hypothetical protein